VSTRGGRSVQGWDLTFATDHLGPFAFTEELLPHLPDGASDASAAFQFLARYLLSPLAPLIRYWSTPRHAARVLTQVLTGQSDATGVYYDENGKPMTGSVQVRDPAFEDRVVAETRALLATIPKETDGSRTGR
jgi:hypothetical protein